MQSHSGVRPLPRWKQCSSQAQRTSYSRNSGASCHEDYRQNSPLIEAPEGFELCEKWSISSWLTWPSATSASPIPPLLLRCSTRSEFTWFTLKNPSRPPSARKLDTVNLILEDFANLFTAQKPLVHSKIAQALSPLFTFRRANIRVLSETTPRPSKKRPKTCSLSPRPLGYRYRHLRVALPAHPSNVSPHRSRQS